ncbi:hypothetical protein A2331_01740 [Candidatus Falkowbacteria bacterium RIFOXYB2_FULL_34_18]|uniref:Radical SAM core domain-containing protein n=1 Tax=Candidatus Falkowbacteria bacterium RIFOXYD2_FULL_34_120 TaxID=1798007 RepID=A0A1F5TQ26_9BACT|nr:MAG: hypothetical protein A2331_01740 [Candidatus Falkowbacteria bacterium RIFOXYB2_FULL_34_18]OGF29334.1 MAG: hypothetical protein A2500_05620 [Candidatus Falkowbacteria bacterium RIFOXYC12_FULL_34_55]OGF36450.1 MAG: hypothetical protein A2466_01280 [Candidatus Falkowbacteria bacterium RIFOXYC2_FULL_34_220]OGF38929.1 MAG: hypothetical protein A2515_06040 [Candidatus Falkowbacteria bacterium RIFOXYD12_FULL_34_57]OGF40948.1 MAG: hypothetical protein A2531_04265 [Candidatus Falkowbacteria bact
MKRPKEIMIEIETRCNLDCDFCFNQNNFAHNGRNIENKLTNEYVKKIINAAVDFDVMALRFTGGEPLMREDIWDLAEYARKKDVKLCLNTNGLLIKDIKTAERIVKYFENVLIPLQYIDFSERSLLAQKKLKVINLLRKAGIKILRVGTVATENLINNFDDFYKLIKKLPINEWELYRVMPSVESDNPFSGEMLKKLVEKLLKVKKESPINCYIANAIPFCAYDPKKIQEVSRGAKAVDGHSRFVIDPRGFAKPMYYINENIGNPLDLDACWNHDFMKKMRSLGFVPHGCRGCMFLEKCKGGCRFSAKIIKGNYGAADPLMNNKNKILK